MLAEECWSASLGTGPWEEHEAKELPLIFSHSQLRQLPSQIQQNAVFVVKFSLSKRYDTLFDVENWRGAGAGVQGCLPDTLATPAHAPVASTQILRGRTERRGYIYHETQKHGEAVWVGAH